MARRIGVFGWGVVAPKAPNIDRFRERLEGTGDWLGEFDGFGPSNFVVGRPEFDFSAYREWIDERFPPNRYPALDKKFGGPTQYAIGAFVQALAQNPEIEAELTALGTRAHVIVGGGLHDIPTYHEQSLALHRSQRTWNRFWAAAENNSAYESYLADANSAASADPPPPPDPQRVALESRDAAEDAWFEYWAGRSPQLRDYLDELRDIESMSIEGDVESGKAAILRKKQGAIQKLRKKWRCPEPPWHAVSANGLWNICNTPASQISMMGKITGATFAPYAACSAFGYSLRLGMQAIERGEAKLVVIGATDPPPHAISVSMFYNARVLTADGGVSKPLTGMRGTHVSGGAAIWIIGDLDEYRGRGWRALGMEPAGIGVTADAHHIITPSVEGPTRAVEMALDAAEISPDDIATWDLHATATPGDYLEVETIRKIVPAGTQITARKGTFGHGMGVGGGWELTAQYLGYERQRLAPMNLTRDELNAQIASVHQQFVFADSDCPAAGCAGKMSMGIGGINVCVISRPLE